MTDLKSVSSLSRNVFVLAASNLPWDLDPALLRRLEKRIMVPMPDTQTRRNMIKLYLSRHVCALDEEDLNNCASSTEGYSGADIKLLCKEAAMRPVRLILSKLELIDTRTESGQSKTQMDLDITKLISQNPISREDLISSLACTKPSTGKESYKKYFTWASEFGSV